MAKKSNDVQVIQAKTALLPVELTEKETREYGKRLAALEGELGAHTRKEKAEATFYALASAEDRLLRSLEIARAVTEACEGRGVIVPEAVALADGRLKKAVLNWNEKLKDYLFTTLESQEDDR